MKKSEILKRALGLLVQNGNEYVCFLIEDAYWALTNTEYYEVISAAEVKELQGDVHKRINNCDDVYEYLAIECDIHVECVSDEDATLFRHKMLNEMIAYYEGIGE